MAANISSESAAKLGLSAIFNLAGTIWMEKIKENTTFRQKFSLWGPQYLELGMGKSSGIHSRSCTFIYGLFNDTFSSSNYRFIE
jgi:hypothetical protein